MSTNKGEEFFFLLYIYIDRAADACIIQSKLCIGWNNFCLWRLKSLQKDKKRRQEEICKSLHKEISVQKKPHVQNRSAFIEVKRAAQNLAGHLVIR